ncbi:dipeptide transmembrane transporter [Microdochium trichocladiopsis]|uniref:Dipeptide transmembrane transporter n=1 Tax=Microdochium trichocladiopsis TaxID=1682393 RepID=A0A9P9BKX5_9PEZI|nr:dipeptide transmembrane transporter [Microdochium trichocladiopsis]KAH7024357.1 dipeptide transmembrane transporter [Microdochium trichocladiopsis]
MGEKTVDIPAIVPNEAGSINDEPTKEHVIDSRADIGLRYIAEHGVVEFTPEEERKVRRKIDMYFLPILAITFGLQYLDKVSIGYSAVYDMIPDLGLVGQQYSWANSLFYFGYLAGEVPANFLMQKLPIGKFVAVNIFIWGVLVMLCAVTKNFTGLAILRFLMGVFEACIGPCWVQLTGMFYKSGEQGARVSVWYSMVGLAVILGGFFSWGIGNIQTQGVKTWQLIFLICGGFTVVWAVIIYLWLPESPAVAKFLDQREKSIAIERLRKNRTGIKNKEFKWAHAIEALKDPQCWMISLWTGVSMMLNIGGSFKPLIIRDMGFTGLTTTLLTMPNGAVEIVAMALGAYFSSKLKNGRTMLMFVIALPTVAGCIMLAVAPRYMTWVRLTGVWTLTCIPASYALLLSLISSNVAGTSKKVVVTLSSFIFFCVGNIVTPQLFIDKEAPYYTTGMRAMLVGVCLTEALTLALGAYYYFENKRRDRLLAETPAEVIAANTFDNEEFLDRTDQEDWMRFRYKW